jgi:4-hydroxyacetophenone monooxygenase
MTVIDTSRRTGLLETTDEQIDEIVTHGDPIALRALLYQFTGDEQLLTMAIDFAPYGSIKVPILADPADIEAVRAEAAAFLKAYRDSGAGPIEFGPPERLARTLALATGRDALPTDELPLWLEELALDPWARAAEWPEEPPAEQLEAFSVVVIGAGMGGLNAAVNLKHAGIDVTVIEKNPGVGGTWYENRYPGARVDTPGRCYTHIFGVSYRVPSTFSTWRENQAYFEWVADTFGIREQIHFDTEVTSVIWDEEDAHWTITANGPDGPRSWRANAVVSAVGLLSRPSLPVIDGMDEFEGRAVHTAQWPEDLDLSGKRVAVIGTGCTGYQMVPEVALVAEHVTVFQRTPQWVIGVPGYRSPMNPQVAWLDRNFPYHVNVMRFLANWSARPELAALQYNIEPEFEDPHTRSTYNKAVRDLCISSLEKKLAARPELIDKMIPEHPPFSARPVIVDSEYSILDALVRDNVTLVTDGVREITRTGVTAADGTHHEVDVIVYATGYKANDFLWPMEVRGREGQTAAQLWAKDGPRAYVGAMLPGFPNFFMLYGPNTNPFGGGLGVINREEMVTRFSIGWMQQLILHAKRSVEVTEDAYWRYNQELDKREAIKVYLDPRAHNYYRNEHGRSAANCPFPATEMWRMLRTPNVDDIVVR